MNWDAEQLKDQLHAELEGPAPAVATALPDIMSRGLRRRRIRQLSSAALALVVVASIGAVAFALDGKKTTMNEPAMPTASGTPVAMWAPASLPTKIPYSTFGSSDTVGVPQIKGPLCATGDYPGNFGAVEVSAVFRERLMSTLRAVAAPASVGELVEQSSANRILYRVDVTDRAGTGSIGIEAGAVPGLPVQIADQQAYKANNCVPPKRIVRTDGTVLQIYPIGPQSPYPTAVQNAVIYRPGGRQYSITVYGMAGQDVIPDDSHPEDWNKSGTGRGTPVLTEAQLGELAVGVAGVD